MDSTSRKTLAHLLRTQRVAGLGTLHRGAPHVSMILYAVSPEFSSFYIHASGLAHHTKNMISDPRVALLIAEADRGDRDPQTLVRLSLRGEAKVIPPSSSGYSRARSAYLAKFPTAEAHFQLGDFSLYRIEPQAGRYVAGFGKIFNLGVDDLERASEIQDG